MTIESQLVAAHANIEAQIARREPTSAEQRAAEAAMRSLRPDPAARPKAARARPHRSEGSVARPQISRLAFLIRRWLRVRPRQLTALDVRTHTRIKRGLQRLERLEKLREQGIIP